MKITVNDYPLAEPGNPVGVRNFRIVTERQIESVRFLRAENGAFFDRRNRTTTITFTVTRLHATVRDAELFLLAHEGEVPASGRVVFTARGDNGQEVERTLDNAMIEVGEATYIGLSTRHAYTLRGGQLESR